MIDNISDAAKELGLEHGKHRAETLANSKSLTVKVALDIIEGYNKGDEDTLSLCPQPLSGEWADDPTPMLILDQIADRVDPNKLRGESIGEDYDDVLDVYEEAYRKGFWDKSIEACTKRLEKK